MIETKGEKTMQLPDVEIVAAKVHASWMKGKQAQGVTSRKAEDGEELMVDYAKLSEKQKAVDRATVVTVYDAIAEAASEKTPGAKAAR